MIFRACVQLVGDFYTKQKLLFKNHSISFIFGFQEHQKCVFKASEAIMQTLPLVPTMVVPTISTYIRNKILAHIFLTTCHRPDNGRVKLVCGASGSFLL